jgi:signal transduction histidine kinase
LVLDRPLDRDPAVIGKICSIRSDAVPDSSDAAISGTNISATTVDVELRYDDAALHLAVRDDGPGPSGAADGHGLLGMRERAATVGGSVRTGPGEGGGFVVEGELPVA